MSELQNIPMWSDQAIQSALSSPTPTPPRKERKERKELTLEEKMEVVRLQESGRSMRQIARELGIGKTQVQCIVKRKIEIRLQYSTGIGRDERYRKARITDFEDVNLLTWQWYKNAVENNQVVTGAAMQQKALEFAGTLGRTTFKASNGWLNSFRKRHNLLVPRLNRDQGNTNLNLSPPSQVPTSSRRSIDLSGSTWSSTSLDWTVKISQLCSDYKPTDIWAVAETGLYYRALPDKVSKWKRDGCSQGENAQERLTALFCCSAAGEKIRPLVIGKSLWPSSFRNISGNDLPVVWRGNRQSWISSSMFEEWLHHLNMKMQEEGRKIALLLSADHIYVARLQFDNISLRFIPSLTVLPTAQPLGNGVIYGIKSMYRIRLLEYMIASLDPSDTTPNLAGVTTVLDAVFWLAKAWEELPISIIRKSFKIAGFPIENVGPVMEDVQLSPGNLLLQACADTDWDTYVTMDDALATHSLFVNPQISHDDVLVNQTNDSISMSRDIQGACGSVPKQQWNAGNENEANEENTATQENDAIGEMIDSDSDSDNCYSSGQVSALRCALQRVRDLQHYAATQGHGEVLHQVMQLQQCLSKTVHEQHVQCVNDQEALPVILVQEDGEMSDEVKPNPIAEAMLDVEDKRHVLPIDEDSHTIGDVKQNLAAIVHVEGDSERHLPVDVHKTEFTSDEET